MDRQCSSCGGFCKKAGCERENTKPKEWVGLTDAEAMEIEDKSPDIRWAIIQAEAKLKEKNT